MRYPAVIDGERGAYGIAIPDLPGAFAAGATVDEALANPESTEGRPWGQRLKKPAGAPLNLG